MAPQSAATKSPSFLRRQLWLSCTRNCKKVRNWSEISRQERPMRLLWACRTWEKAPNGAGFVSR